MKKPKTVSKNYMDTVFVPSKEITFTRNEDKMIVVAVTNKGPFNWLAQKLYKSPRVSYITLDKYGTVLWNCLNGKNTVFDVVNEMIKAFPEEENNMLNRVITFFHTLQSVHYIINSEKIK